MMQLKKTAEVYWIELGRDSGVRGTQGVHEAINFKHSIRGLVSRVCICVLMQPHMICG